MRNEIQKELIDAIIPFWEALRDDEYGGFYGYMDYDLNLDKKAEKGCILNSRITWFFASAYKALKGVRASPLRAGCRTGVPRWPGGYPHHGGRPLSALRRRSDAP